MIIYNADGITETEEDKFIIKIFDFKHFNFDINYKNTIIKIYTYHKNIEKLKCYKLYIIGVSDITTTAYNKDLIEFINCKNIKISETNYRRTAIVCNNSDMEVINKCYCDIIIINVKKIDLRKFRLCTGSVKIVEADYVFCSDYSMDLYDIEVVKLKKFNFDKMRIIKLTISDTPDVNLSKIKSVENLIVTNCVNVFMNSILRCKSLYLRRIHNLSLKNLDKDLKLSLERVRIFRNDACIPVEKSICYKLKKNLYMDFILPVDEEE